MDLWDLQSSWKWFLAMDLLCFRGRVFKEEMLPANTKNMVTLYRNSFEDLGKKINTNRLMLVKSMVKKMIRSKIEKNSMPKLKTNLLLLVINSWYRFEKLRLIVLILKFVCYQVKRCQVKGCDVLKDMLVHVKASLYNGWELKQKRCGYRREA